MIEFGCCRFCFTHNSVDQGFTASLLAGFCVTLFPGLTCRHAAEHLISEKMALSDVTCVSASCEFQSYRVVCEVLCVATLCFNNSPKYRNRTMQTSWKLA